MSAAVATPYMIHPARVVARRTETEGIYTFTLQFVDPELRRSYAFRAGQFNMLYAPGVGEVAISIVSDPTEPQLIEHTIRIVGRVTGVMARWKVGDIVGVRGPYGNGWPVEEAHGRDVVIITGGVGCAPTVGVINYIFRRREQYGELHILHGVKTPNDLLYRERFDEWRRAPRTKVYLTSDRPDKSWHYRIGVVTELFDELDVPSSSIVMMCGPEVMMRMAARSLLGKGIADDSIYLSMERRMECAVGLCGHCQWRQSFVCKDGPVFSYREARELFRVSGI
ncbi:MAG TPA: FAD/NAD(P)-binding protein [Candidatus Binataceae bacterium]|nr:FAD/NAD(P)-binding protein [Candidatus Binataceae bacterium]